MHRSLQDRFLAMWVKQIFDKADRHLGCPAQGRQKVEGLSRTWRAPLRHEKRSAMVTRLERASEKILKIEFFHFFREGGGSNTFFLNLWKHSLLKRAQLWRCRRKRGEIYCECSSRRKGLYTQLIMQNWVAGTLDHISRISLGSMHKLAWLLFKCEFIRGWCKYNLLTWRKS